MSAASSSARPARPAMPATRLAPFALLFALGLLFDALYFARWRPEFDFYLEAEPRTVQVLRAESSLEPDRCGGAACAHLWVARTTLALRERAGAEHLVSEAYADKKPYAETRIAQLKALVGRELELYLSDSRPAFFAERKPVFPWLQMSTLLLISVLTMLPLALSLRAWLRAGR